MEQEESDNWVIFGDLQMAQVFDYKIFNDDDDGKDYITFLIRPSNRLLSTYQINDYDDEGLIERTYSSTQVIHASKNLHSNRWLVMVDINEGETPVSKYYSECIVVIDDLKRMMKTEKYAKYYALQELEDERTQKEVSLKQYSRLVKTVAEARGRSDGDEGEVDSDE